MSELIHVSNMQIMICLRIKFLFRVRSPKYRRKYVKKCQIFEDFLIVTKKQHITLNFDSNNNLVPFDTLVDPDAEKVRNEKLWRAF